MATITQLTGDVTASGHGAIPATIANLAVTNAKIANATIDLTSKVTNVLPVANGGTNSSVALSGNRFVVSTGGSIHEQAAVAGNRAVVTDSNGLPVASATTDTEIGYVNGVTSSIQTQFTGKASLSGATFTGAIVLAGDAVAALNPVSKQQFDAAIQGLEVKSQVFVASKVNISSLSGEQTIDGQLTSASRVLLLAQSAPEENGIWVTAAGAWSRPSDFDLWSEITGSIVPVGPDGSANNNSLWMCTVGVSGTIGVTAITFIEINTLPVNLATEVTGTLPIGNGGTGQTTASAAFGALSPLTTKGDILGYSTLNARVPVGSNDQVLTADSTQALGVKWATPASSAIAPTQVISVSSNVTLTDKAIHLVDTSSARSLTLPSPTNTRYIMVMDKIGTGNTNNITILRAGSEKIQNVAASYVMNGDFQVAVFISDGTDWWDVA